MTYPLISEYIEAIESTENNLDELSNLRPVLDNSGKPVMKRSQPTQKVFEHID